MFGFNRAADERPVLVQDQPELWVPDALTDVFAEVEPIERERINPLTHPNWVAELRGEDRLHLDLGGTVKDPTRGPLGRHISAAIAAKSHGGIEPGTMPNPRNHVQYVAKPTKATENAAVQVMQWEEAPLDPEVRRAYYDNHDAAPKFREQVSSVVADVLSDSDRAWAAFVHLRLIDAAQRELDARIDRVKRAENSRRVLECPICLQMNGHIATRELEPGETPSRFNKGPVIRSCKPCWHEARSQHQSRRSAERLASGLSRADRIAEWMQAEEFNAG